MLIAVLLWQLGHIVYPSTWAFWAQLALGWDATAIGWSLAAAGLAMGTVQVFVTGRAIARFGEARTIVIGMVVGGLCFLAYVFAREGWVVYTIIFLSALQGLVYPSMNALLSRMTDASHQGALQGGMSSIASIAAIIGPLAMTQALAFGAENGQPGGAFLLAALLVFAALTLIWFGVSAGSPQSRWPRWNRRARGAAWPSQRTTFTAPDGIALAWHEMGEGRPVLLLHGLFSERRHELDQVRPCRRDRRARLSGDHARPARARAKRRAARSGLPIRPTCSRATGSR